MARYDDEKARYQGYGTPYLTPAQELTESRMGDDRALAAQLATNPLAQHDAAVLAGAAAPAAPATYGGSTVEPNPLVKPPVPFAAMGTEQRIAWQALEDKRRDEQSVLEGRSLDADIRRQNLELRAEQIRQNRGLAAEIPKLREALNRSPEEYQDLKADLTQRFPIGMGSPESDRIFGEYERIFTKTEGVKAELNKQKIAREETARQRRIDAGYRDAEKQGADVLREYAAIIDKDPVKGPDDANKYLAGVQQRNAVSVLRNAGMGEQEIRQKYGGGETGRPFDYQAAGQAPKGKAAVLAEKNKATTEWLALDKVRRDVGFDPSKPEDTPEWTPQHEAAYQTRLEYMNSLTPQIGDNRAGVQGMATKYVPYERTLNPAARVPLPQSVQPGAAPQRPSAVATAPKAVPPPLNPAYPEQWVGGKRYVQMPDGKLYLSKVQ